MKDKVFIAKVQKVHITPGMEGFGGVVTSNPADRTADFAANESPQPDSDYTRSHPWLCS